MLHLVQRLLNSSDGFDNKLHSLRSSVEALKDGNTKACYPYRVKVQAQHTVLTFCVRSLCSDEDAPTQEHISELWHILSTAAIMDDQVNEVSIPVTVLDAARKTLTSSISQGTPSCIRACSLALNMLQPFCKVPATQAIKLCTAVLDALAKLGGEQGKVLAISMATEAANLLYVALKYLLSAQGLFGSRSWQAMSTKMIPSAIAIMWHAQKSSGLGDSMRLGSSALIDSLQVILSHHDHVVTAANEFQQLAKCDMKSTSSDGQGQTDAKRNHSKDHQANGVLTVWWLVEQLGRGESLSMQEMHTLNGAGQFFAWLIRTYHRCYAAERRDGPDGEKEIERHHQGSVCNKKSAEQIFRLPWNVLCVILNRSSDALKQASLSQTSQKSACIAMHICVEALTAAQECKAYSPIQDVDGNQLAVLMAFVQSLCTCAKRLNDSGIYAVAVMEAMELVLSTIVAMEHRCITGQMDFVCSMMWVDGYRQPIEDDGCVQSGAADCMTCWHSSLQALGGETTFPRCQLFCAVLEAYASLRQLDALISTVLSSIISAWRPAVELALCSAPAECALKDAIAAVPSAQVPTLIDVLCRALQLQSREGTTASLPTVIHFGAVMLSAFQVGPQQAAAGACAAQRLVRAMQSLVNVLSQKADAVGLQNAQMCAKYCLPLARLQAETLHFYGSCTAQDPALNPFPQVISLPAALSKHLRPLLEICPSDLCGHRCPGGVPTDEMARRHAAVSNLRTADAQLYALSAAALSCLPDVIGGSGGALAQDAVSGGSLCLAWLTNRLCNMQARSVHSLSCTTTQPQTAVEQSLLEAASDTAALAVLWGLQKHVTGAHGTAASILRSAALGIQMDVVIPLMQCISQWLPHADIVPQKALVRSCLLTCSDSRTAQYLHRAGLYILTGRAERIACSDSILLSKTANRAWPSAFCSVARRLQARISASAAAAVLSGRLKEYTTAANILRMAALANKPSEDCSMLLQLMRDTADLLRFENTRMEQNDMAAACMQSGALAQDDLEEVLRSTNSLLALVQALDVQMLAAFSKKRKWWMIFRALASILCSMAVVNVWTHAACSASVDSHEVVLVAPLQQLAAVLAQAKPDEYQEMQSAELAAITSLSACVCVHSGIEEVTDAALELVKHASALELSSGCCKNLNATCRHAHQHIPLLLYGSPPITVVNEEVSPTHTNKTNDGQPRGTTSHSKRKRIHKMMADIILPSGSVGESLHSLVVLNGVTAGALQYYQKGKHARTDCTRNILSFISDLSQTMERHCQEYTLAHDHQGKMYPPLVAKLLVTLRVAAACCSLETGHDHSAKHITPCVQDLLSVLNPVSSCTSGTGAAGARLMETTLQSLLGILKLLPRVPPDNLETLVLRIQFFCLDCMTFASHLWPMSKLIPIHDFEISVSNPVQRAASLVFRETLSISSITSSSKMVQCLTLGLDYTAEAASAAMATLLLLLESQKQPVLQCIQRSMPQILRSILQCLFAQHSVDWNSTVHAEAQLPRAHALHARRAPDTADHEFALSVLSLRCLESLLGQKAVISSLGSDGGRIPAGIMAVARGLDRLFRDMNPSDLFSRIHRSVVLLSGVCAAVTAILRHRSELAAVMWPLVAPMVRLDILVQASLLSRGEQNYRYTDALLLGSHAIASVYETASTCDSFKSCRHSLLKDYVMVVSGAQDGPQTGFRMMLPNASNDRLRQAAMALVGSLSDIQLQQFHASLAKASSARDVLSGLKNDYHRLQKFSGKV